MEWNVSLLSNGTSSRPFGLFFFFFPSFFSYLRREWKDFPRGGEKGSRDGGRMRVSFTTTSRCRRALKLEIVDGNRWEEARIYRCWMGSLFVTNRIAILRGQSFTFRWRRRLYFLLGGRFCFKQVCDEAFVKFRTIDVKRRDVLFEIRKRSILSPIILAIHRRGWSFERITRGFDYPRIIRRLADRTSGTGNCYTYLSIRLAIDFHFEKYYKACIYLQVKKK